MSIRYLLIIVLTLSSSLIITSCNKSYKIWDNNREIKTEYTREATRVLLLPNCPCVEIPKDIAKPKALPILTLTGALIPVAADFAASAFTTYLEKSEAALSAQFLGSGTGQLFEKKPNNSGELLGEKYELKNPCLVIARGKFGPIENENTLEGQVGQLNIDKLKTIGLADYPDFYFEAWLGMVLENDKDSVLLSIKPQMLHFAKRAAKRTSDGSKFIGMILILVGNSPASSERDEIIKHAISTIPFQFQKVIEGTEYLAMDGSETKPINPLFDQNKIFKINKYQFQSHFNLYVFITETEDAPLFLQLMLNYVKGKKDDLSKALQNAINEGIKMATGEK